MDIQEVFYEVEYDGNITLMLAELDYFKLHPTLTWIYLFVLVTSTVVGNVGNFLIIAAVLAYDKLKTKANVFVVSLAVADMNVASVVQYFSVVGLIDGYKFFIDKNWLCHLVTVICHISCAASLLNMAAVAINRTKLALMVTAVWFVASLVDIGPLTGWWGGHSYDTKTMLCSWNRLADFSYTVFFVCVIVSPIGLVLFCYVSIFVEVRRSRQRITELGGRMDTGKGATNHVQLSLVKSLFIIFIVFMICWLPYAIVVVTDFADRLPKAVHLFTTQFAHTNSSVNSIIYGMSNPTFRDGYLHVLRKCLPRRLQKRKYLVIRSQNESRRGRSTHHISIDTQSNISQKTISTDVSCIFTTKLTSKPTSILVKSEEQVCSVQHLQ